MIIAILMIYVAGNIRTLINVGREIKLIEQKQVRRLERGNQKTATPKSNVPGSFGPQSPKP
jgi:hypothetical protein